MSEKYDTKITQDSRYSVGGNADVGRVLGGVTVSWLSQVFRMNPITVKKRLKDCPPVANRKAGYLYDVKQASQYLVKPVFDIDGYMQTMKAVELPTHLQDQFWSAMNKRQKFEENAKDLWRTTDVVTVFGTVFQLIKSSMQLWADTIERTTGMTSDQKKVLKAQVDGLQKSIYQELVKLPTKDVTLSQHVEMKRMGKPETVRNKVVEEDYADLI